MLKFIYILKNNLYNKYLSPIPQDYLENTFPERPAEEVLGDMMGI